MLENIIIAVISVLGGGGLVGVITWRATSRKAEEEAEAVAISNDSAVIAQWKDIYEKFKLMHDQEIENIKSQCAAEYSELKNKEEHLQEITSKWENRQYELQNKIDELYKEINRHHEEKAKVTNELMDVRVQCEKLDRMKCERRGCKDRIPPSDAMM